MKSVKEIQRSLHSRYLAILNFTRFTQQDAFIHAYDVATEAEKAEALRHIDTLNQEKLTVWTKQILRFHKLYEFLDVRYLRTLAQESGIRGYAAMGRIELVSRLQKNGSVKEHEQAASSRASSGDGNTSNEVRLDKAGELSATAPVS